MKFEPLQSDIDDEFVNTNFGPAGATPDGRKRLVAECVLKRACAFKDGATIECICRNLRLLTAKGTPTKKAKQWAYLHLVWNGK